MRVLVTGIDGFAGGYMAEYLLTQPSLELHGTFRRGAAPEALSAPGSRLALHRLDIRDHAGVRELLRALQPDRIIHLAGRGYIPDSFSDPAQTYAVNVSGVVAILEGARAVRDESGISPAIVLAGAGQVYDAAPARHRPLREEDPLGPVTPYAASKACAELIALDYQRNFGLEVIVTRPFNHIGPRQAARFVCADFARQLALMSRGTLAPVLRVGNLEASRDFTDVRDDVRAYWMLLSRLPGSGSAGERPPDPVLADPAPAGASSGMAGKASSPPGTWQDAPAGPHEAGAQGALHRIYNICSGQGTKISEVLDVLQEISGVNVRRVADPSKLRRNDLPAVVGDPGRLEKATGWKPRIPLRQTLTEMYHFWRDAPETGA